MQAQMLAPAAVLIAWTLVVLFWMAASRFPALAKQGQTLSNAPKGIRGQDSEPELPPSVNWKSHNYSHLLEQPTVFYPVVVIIALMGGTAGDVLAAWIYVGLRIAHSIWQATTNTIPVRFSLFLLSSFVLIYLAYRAISLTLFADPGVI